MRSRITYHKSLKMVKVRMINSNIDYYPHSNLSYYKIILYTVESTIIIKSPKECTPFGDRDSHVLLSISAKLITRAVAWLLYQSKLVQYESSFKNPQNIVHGHSS
jgi:hypothetical protein